MAQLPSLVLHKAAIAVPNSGLATVTIAQHREEQVILVAAGNKINILDQQAQLLHCLPFELAFPVHSTLTSVVEAVAFDASSGRLAASSHGRVGIWEMTGAAWRVHSSFSTLHHVDVIDFAAGTIVAGGDVVSLWSIDESEAWSAWSRVGFDEAAFTVRLSPSAQVLASVKTGSNLVKLSSILPLSVDALKADRLRFRSYASHSLPVRSIGWRPTDNPADSGSILFTTTVDGVFRIWGYMIDEPDFFSLWATLDVHSALPQHVPLSTIFRRTRAMWPDGDATTIARRGTKDEFVTVFSDGSVHLTTVSNFDCRPPTCLSQTTSVVQPSLFQPSQLVNLRYSLLIPSTVDSSEFSLLARCSRGTLLRVELSVPDIPHKDPPVQEPPRIVEVNVVGEVRELVPSICGEAVLVLGNKSVIQAWEMEENHVVVQKFLSEAGVGPDAKIALWHDSRLLVAATSTGLTLLELRRSARLRFVDRVEVVLPPLLAFFVARTEEVSLSTTIVAITPSFDVLTWTYNAALRCIVPGSTESLAPALGSPRAVQAVPVPIRPRAASPAEGVSVLVIDEAGTLTFWTAAMPDSAYAWKEEASVRTGKKEISHVACSSALVTAIVSKNGEDCELSIWDSKESEFTSGQQFSELVENDILDLCWSEDAQTLAVATSERVTLHCAQRLDDLSGNPSWITYASISDAHLTASPLSAICWFSKGFAVAYGDHVFFHSSKLTTGEDCHAFAAERIGPLPNHHPQLLFQSLLHGESEVVIKILAGLAGQLTEDGDVTPVHRSRSPARITVQDFLMAKSGEDEAKDKDIFSALTSVAARQLGETKATLTEEDCSRLLSALKKCSMRGLTKIEHAHLSVVVQTVYEIQRQQGSLDSNGLRYLISMRSFFIYNANSLRPFTTPTATASLPRLKYRDVVWAFHSESQDLLLDASVKACPDRLTWENAKALGIFFWIKAPDVLAAQLEIVGRSEYLKVDSDTKDPITASLFYLALRKKHIVLTLWKQAGGHSDQRSMLKFLVNDFEQPRWRSAALKNAFALLSKQRFLFAAAFFLLGDSLKDAVSVCLRQLDDFPLAIAIARVYEGDDGPVLRSILEGTVLPLAFKQGFRWLASWAFWMLNRRDLAIQTIVTPLADLAARIPYQLSTIGSPMHEDPGLILLFAQLRSWSLQTLKGAIAVPGRTEFNFVLHVSRVLCRMGCHVLALKLVRSWEFYHPARIAPLPPSREPSQFRPRHSLRRLSTRLDIEIPSNLGSRAPSPERTGGVEFHEVLKEAKKEAKAPPEFDMNSFAF